MCGCLGLHRYEIDMARQVTPQSPAPSRAVCAANLADKYSIAGAAGTIAARPLLPPCLNPQVENVVEIEIRQQRRGECWSMDFVSDKLADGRSFRIFTVIDQFTRECVALEADRSMTGKKVAEVLERARQERSRLPGSITVDNGSEFSGRALEAWAIANDVQLCFIRPGPSGGERIHREFQWPSARRVFERGVVLFAGRCAREAGEVPRALQSPAPAQCPGGSRSCWVRGAAQAGAESFSTSVGRGRGSHAAPSPATPFRWHVSEEERKL